MKWTITMTQEELYRKTVVEQAIDKRITQKEGAVNLGISGRHFNAYLPEFIHFYNQRFAVLPRSTKDNHLPLDNNIDLDFLFSIHNTRIISKDLMIRVNHATYQIVTRRPPQYLAKREVLVTLDKSGAMKAYLNSQPLTLKLIQKQPKQAQVVSTNSQDNPVYVPPRNHPWRTYGKKVNGSPVLVTE